jgi:hypothetical protein
MHARFVIKVRKSMVASQGNRFIDFATVQEIINTAYVQVHYNQRFFLLLELDIKMETNRN